MPGKDDPNNHELSTELKACLKELVDKYESEDGWVRKQQVKLWKKNDEFWHGIQFIFWSESRQDWISPTETRWFQQEEGREEAEGPFYDFVINIYKAHGEAVIAALGAQTPTVRFPPDDAEDDDDLRTSKTYAKIADLIQRHNQSKVTQLMSLFMLWNQGLVCAYHAPRADKAFGMTNIENFRKELTCPECDAVKPVDDADDQIEGMPCPTCGAPMEVNTVLDSFEETPKSRVMIDIFGPLHVKVPYWARKQSEFSYLIKALDQPRAFLKSLFPHIQDEIEQDYQDSQQYERMARTPSSFNSFSRVDENRDLATFRQIWLRPWVFEGLPKSKEAEKKKLKKLFPNGVYVGFVGKVYAESRDEDMDKYWTIGKAGLSQYIHSDPLGQPLISVQELRNVLVNLTAETVEQGMSSGFADPDVLNFDVYSRHEARPGMIYPARNRPGSRMSDSFYETSKATLSEQVGLFGQQLDKDGQFVVGSFPSLYGGPGEGKSRTLGEYNLSRQMALQRLTIAWSLFVSWWAKMMEKCVHLYVENLVEDERYVAPKPDQKDSYINIWIRKAELTGKVGEVEPEGSETFPVSTPQKQALFFKLLELNNQFINAAVFDSTNRRLIADLLGFTDLEIPGEDQRIKQMCIIQAMIQSGVTIPPNPLVDDSTICVNTSKHFLAGQAGMDLQKENPEAYAAVQQNLQAHAQIIAKNEAQEFQKQAILKQGSQAKNKGKDQQPAPQVQ